MNKMKIFVPIMTFFLMAIMLIAPASAAKPTEVNDVWFMLFTYRSVVTR